MTPRFGSPATAGPSSPPEVPDAADEINEDSSSSPTSFTTRSALVGSAARQPLVD